MGTGATALVAAAMMIACPSVQRYGPDDPGPAATGDRRPPPRQQNHDPTTRPRPGRTVGGDGEALGNGSLPSELLAGARRVLGWRFARDGVDEVSAFFDHLKAVADWDGKMVTTADPRPGDLWVAHNGRVAVVEAAGGQGRVVVIGPRDARPVERYEIDGGTFHRAVSRPGVL